MAADTRVLIVYRTKYGSTEARARKLAEALGVPTELVDLARDRNPDVTDFDAVIVGGPVYGGKMPREIGAFCERRREDLLSRRVGLFICCLYRGEKAMAQLTSLFPDWLVAHAVGREWLGGALEPDRLTGVDRLLVRGVPGAGERVSVERPDSVQVLARAVRGQGTEA
jgi:menaquinone-dependent protoporphyrinogen oxidase